MGLARHCVALAAQKRKAFFKASVPIKSICLYRWHLGARKPVRAIGYISQNKTSVQPKNLDLAFQEDVVRKYAQERNWEMVDVYTEVISTANQHRQPMLEQLFSDAQAKRFDVLIIPRLDRLTRNIRMLNHIIGEICTAAGVKLISLEEELDTTTDYGKKALNLIDIVTKWDTKRISDRTKEIIARKRQKGERVGHAPYGFTYQNKRLVPVKKEIEVIELICEKRDGGMSYHKIAKLLNDKKVLSKRGGIWYAETVKTVFQNRSSAKYQKEEAEANA